MARTKWAGLSDAALVVRVGRWQDQALAEIYRRHAGAVYGLALRILGERSAAEEVVQEIFVKLWTEPERYDPQRGSLRSWLLAQAHSRSIDRLRSDRSRRARERREAERTATAGYGLEERIVDLVVAENVGNGLAALTDDERAAIELAYFGGYTYKEVARMLGAPEGTIKSRIRSGLKKLHGLMAQAGVSS